MSDEPQTPRREPASTRQPERDEASRARSRRMLILGSVLAVAAVATVVVVFVLVTMFEHKQEARTPFVRVVEVDEASTDPRPWGLNWPHQFDAYLRTAEGAEYGGSSALTTSKLEESPWLRRLYAGYAFSIDYREARGHAYMLYDQTVTERVTRRPQAGACLHCHASTTVLYRAAGLEAMGVGADDEALREGFNMPAVIRGFEELSRQPYHQVLARLAQMPDGTPDVQTPLHPQMETDAEVVIETPEGHIDLGNAHPVSCIDCHDPQTMAIRVTRPGFMQGIADLAASDEPVPHCRASSGGVGARRTGRTTPTRWRAGRRCGRSSAGSATWSITAPTR